ncbi:MAG: DUF4251 domain-containing protein [Bacteroidales bacterium]|jgi:hypothetical protein|nr:DUF4251 domain-containing protein [Bacteroidales bacterium]
MKRVFIIAVLTALSFGLFAAPENKNKKREKELDIIELLESGRFRFVAHSAIPASGKAMINLTSDYDLRVCDTHLKAWLPFYGRIYRADPDPTDGGIKFDSSAKTFNVRYNRRKEIYEFTMVVRTPKDEYKLRLSAGISGSASLSVSAIHRQHIYFYGNIEPLPEKYTEDF